MNVKYVYGYRRGIEVKKLALALIAHDSKKEDM
jgi:hypothetical protein